MSERKPERQHISDGAWQAMMAHNKVADASRDICERIDRDRGTVCLTVAEHDELLRYVKNATDYLADRNSAWAEAETAMSNERLHCGCATDEHTIECPTIHGDIARQAHAMSHPLAQEIDQLRAELAAAKRAQMMLQAVCTDLHRQLQGRDDGGNGFHVRSGGVLGGSNCFVASNDGADNSRVARLLMSIPEADRRLGRGNGAMDE